MRKFCGFDGPVPLMDNSNTGMKEPMYRWAKSIALAVALLLGGIMFLLFLILFLNLWTTTGAFSAIQLVVYFGTPALEVLALVLVLFMTRRNKGLMLGSLLIVLWCANTVNLVLYFIGTFGI